MTKKEKHLLAAAKYTIEEVDRRIKLGQLPVATRMLLLGLRAAVNAADSDKPRSKRRTQE